MWYLSVGFLKGLTRLLMLFLLTLDSFFQAAKCSFPDGYESWDTSHCVFSCFVMERVYQDQRRLQQEREFKQLVSSSTQGRLPQMSKDSAQTPQDGVETPARDVVMIQQVNVEVDADSAPRYLDI